MFPQPTGRRAQAWTAAEIAAAKRRIKAALDAESGDDPRRRASAVLRRLQELGDALDGGVMLERLIYAMSGLVLHQRRGVLSRAQVKRLAQVIGGILQLRGVKPGKAKGTAFYNELYTLLSQISRKLGEHRLAAWQQHLARLACRTETAEGPGFHRLATANRALRLGDVTTALALLTEARDGGLPPRHLHRAWILEARCLRLLGRCAEARALVDGLARQGGVPPAVRQELAWEGLCADARRRGDPGVLVRATRRGKSHETAAYVLEAALWVRAHATGRWRDEVIGLRQLRRRDADGLRGRPLLTKAVATLEACEDERIPLLVRVQQLGDVLDAARRLVGLEQELLVTAAAARWLIRKKLTDLATLALDEYRALSLRVTAGEGADALGLMGDAYGRSWYAGESKGSPDAGDGAA